MTGNQNQPLTHQDVEARDWVRLYTLGRLAEGDEASFEEHLMECAECFEQVRLDDQMAAGMKEVAAEEVTRLAVQLSLWHRIVQQSVSRRGWILSLILAAVLPGSLWWQQRAQLEELRAPSAHTTLYSLGVTRQASSRALTPIELGEKARWLVLQLELPRIEAETYAVELVNPQGDVLWQQEGLEPDANETLALSLHSQWLEPGALTLRLTPIGAPEGMLALEFLVR